MTDPKKIVLDFGAFAMTATLFATQIGNRFYERLPCTVSLTRWGRELYGSIGVDLGEQDPVPSIPPGGIAYTNQGNFFCLFFGQNPAWPVEDIGRIDDDQWTKLEDSADIAFVRIRVPEKK